MTFKLAHLSDPHVGPLPTPAWPDLIGKRLTGYWNWHHKRFAIHSMDVLDAIVTDILSLSPDHVALGGDLVNIGLAAEFPLAAKHLTRLGNPEQVSIVPGNHDAYVGESLGLMQATFGAHMVGDDGSAEFPFVRRRDGIALVSLCSAIPTLPFLASGAIGAAQLARLERALSEARAAGETVVVLIHHPPHQGGSRLFRGLRDAAQLEAVLARCGADLVIHGHNHKLSIHHLPGPGGTSIPVVGVASASAIPGDAAHRAAWHLYRIRRDAGRLSITLDVRGMETPHATVTVLDHLTIA